MERNLIQDFILGADAHVAYREIKGPKARDRACFDYANGYLHGLTCAGMTHAHALVDPISAILCGGYLRIHQMANDIRAKADADYAKGEGK